MVKLRMDKEGMMTITIDASHDPWSILATRIVQFIQMDLDEMGLQISNVDKILDKLEQNHGTIQ
jgi:hypothetical protein